MARPEKADSASLDAEAQAAARALGIEGLRVCVLGGIPHIEGAVANFRLKRAAAQLVGLMTGTNRVVNRLRVAPREARSDRAVAQSMKSALEQALGVEATTVRPEVSEGVALLRGTVSSLSSRCAAEQAAWSVGGVTDVINRVHVASLVSSASGLARQLETDLSACLGLPSGTIAVEIQGDTARLEGAVPSPYHRVAAEDLVRAHEMVRHVLNSLSVPQALEGAPRPSAEERASMQAS